jgi:hypothetical protein
MKTIFLITGLLLFAGCGQAPLTLPHYHSGSSAGVHVTSATSCSKYITAPSGKQYFVDYQFGTASNGEQFQHCLVTDTLGSAPAEDSLAGTGLAACIVIFTDSGSSTWTFTPGTTTASLVSTFGSFTLDSCRSN